MMNLKMDIVDQLKKSVSYRTQINNLVEIDPIISEHTDSTISNLIDSFDPILERFDLDRSPGLVTSISLIKCCYDIQRMINSPLQSVDFVELLLLWLRYYTKTIKYGLYYNLPRDVFDTILLDVNQLEDVVDDPTMSSLEILFYVFVSFKESLVELCSNYVDATSNVHECFEGILVSLSSIRMMLHWLLYRDGYDVICNRSGIIIFNNIIINAFNVVRMYIRPLLVDDNNNYHNNYDDDVVNYEHILFIPIENDDDSDQNDDQNDDPPSHWPVAPAA